MKLVLQFQKLPLINDNFSLKSVINQGPVQSRESDASLHNLLEYKSRICLQSLQKSFVGNSKYWGQRCSFHPSFKFQVYNFGKREMWNLKNWFHRMKKEDISSIKLMVPKLRTASVRIRNFWWRHLVKGTKRKFDWWKIYGWNPNWNCEKMMNRNRRGWLLIFDYSRKKQ